MNLKKGLKRLWKFYWEDNSILSYLFFIIVTYVTFKFLLFPLVLNVTGLSDVVAIMTTSMVHEGFEEFYYYDYFQSLNFSTSEINNFPYSNGLYIGDVLLVKETSDYEVGDVIVFKSPYYPKKLIHRVVRTNPLTTKGDNNANIYSFDKNISEVIGEVVFRIPLIGYPRFLMYELLGI